MRIRSLEISGFKSFGDRVVLAFDRGISAIVGPNGCGKSNIVDAIRWVMGEQNPRHLRGSGMEDVIFAGTESKAPIGMAEVILTFDNSEGIAPEPYGQFSEIQVARRLYRSGESEYLINKTQCRLRDVTDFFLDTGIGVRGYTIVEQGKIAELVSTRPQDRRFILEEAAGISKYRQRRRETERKLAATEQNLLRVTDILGELKRQINSLDRQARRANRYKELNARLRDLELIVSWEEFGRENELRSDAERKLEDARAEGVALDARVSRAESTLESERRAHLDRERELQASSEKLFGLRSEIQSRENRAQFEKREREELGRLVEERTTEVEELESQLADHSTRHQQTLVDLSAVEEQLAGYGGTLETREQELREHAERLATVQGRRDGLQAKLVQTAAEAATLQSRSDALADRRNEIETQLRRSEEALEASTQTAEGIRTEEQSLEDKLRHGLQEKDELGRRLAELIGEHEAAVAQQESERTALGAGREMLQQVGARLETLREADQRENARVAQTIERLPDDARRRVRGVLSDVLRVDDGLEVALEAVLTGRLDAVLVENADSALALMAALRKEAAGRATAVPLDAGAAHFDSSIVPMGRPLLEFVRADGEYRRVAERLLRGVILVDDLDAVVRRFGAQDLPATFVTRHGELLDPAGTVTGGTGAPAGAISRSSDIRRATEELAGLETRCAALEVRAAEELARAEALAGEAENARNRLHTAELVVVNMEKDLERARERGKAAFESTEGFREDRGKHTAALERMHLEIREVGERLEASLAERREAEGSRDVASSEITTFAAELERVEQRLVQQRVQLAEQGARRDQLREKRAGLEAQLREARDWIGRRREEIERARTRSSSLGESLVQVERELQERILVEEGLRTAQTALRETYDASNRVVEELEGESRSAGREREEVRERVQACELAVQEVRMRGEQLQERILERYSLDLANYEPPAELREGDADARATELKRVREGLQSLGEVNLASIEEYEEVSERHRYLSEQKADLELSIERLRNAIARINRTSRQRFRETFEAVNAEFKKTFPTMFRGGRAELSLTESEDVLEAGIEITAQPPGKKLQNVNLLSGGEKSLTALALLMSVFAVKPSPFFLLDEVDAALDDANVGRYDALLRERSGDSQFLVITHNKSSIESADKLFGVTMQEPGLSKLVTVDLVS